MARLIRLLLSVNYVLAAIAVALVIFTYWRATGQEINPPGTYPVPHIKTSADGTIKVMVIDTGIDDKSSLLKPWLVDPLQGVGVKDEFSDYVDTHGHGTHVAGIIIYGGLVDTQPFIVKDGKRIGMPRGKTVCGKVKIYSCHFFHPKDTVANVNALLGCLKRASREKMDLVNFSGGGEDFQEDEFKLIKELQTNGTLFVTAVGNEHADIKHKPYYPAYYAFATPITKEQIRKIKSRTAGIIGPGCLVHNNDDKDESHSALTNVVSVGAVNKQMTRLSHSNYGINMPWELGENVFSTLPYNQVGYMTGTSQAAAMFSHRILLKKCEELNP